MYSSTFNFNIRWLIFVSTIIRCFIACSIELGNDEVYYYTYAMQPDWNHFDHPPLVGILIRIFTINLNWVNEFSMRAGAILSAAVSTWLIAILGQLIKNERTGYIAAILYNASIYTSIIAGLFILPDSPAVVFWLAAMFCMVKIIKYEDNADLTKKNLLLVGLWIGMAVMSKVHGLFLWIGFAGYILFYNRRLLKRTELYISLIITCIIISPILLWNIKYDFITWRFHGDRIVINETGINLSSFTRAFFGQYFYNGPINLVLYVIAFIAINKKKWFVDKKYIRLFLLCAIPLIITTQAISLFREVLPHWSGPAFVFLMLISAAWLDEGFSLHINKWRKVMVTSSLFLTLVIMIGGVIVIQYYPGTLGEKRGVETGKGDVTLDMYGWKQLLPAFDSIRTRDINNNVMKPDAALLINKWFPGAHLYFYVAQPLQMQIVGEGALHDLHKFAWLNRREGYISKGEDAYYIVPSNYYTDPTSIYGKDFQRIVLIDTIPQSREGKIVRYWYVYQLKDAQYSVGNTVPSNSINWLFNF